MAQNWQRQYELKKTKLLNDINIYEANRKDFTLFFEQQEYKLKRQTGNGGLDASNYKTLYGYLGMLGNVNLWFENMPLRDITPNDFKRFYDLFEDGKILTSTGKPFKDRGKYYNKIFRSTFFEMIGKKELVKEVMRFHHFKAEEQVRFIKEADVKALVAVAVSPVHRLLIWLAFDIGENINALLQLTKRDFTRTTDADTNVPEYRVNLRKETLKRSRTARSEITNFAETTQLLDILLKDMGGDELLFKFEYRNAKKILDRAVRITKVRCTPAGQLVTWKDLRSSMACDLLEKGWTTDEINRRLGHRPSSAEIDKYVNFLAIDGKKPKRKIYEHNLGKLQAELDQNKNIQKQQAARLQQLEDNMRSLLEQEMKKIRDELKARGVS